MANPALPPDKKLRLTRKLMQARRKKGTAMRVGYNGTRGEWVARFGPAMVAFGGRRAPWWRHRSADVHPHMLSPAPIHISQR